MIDILCILTQLLIQSQFPEALKFILNIIFQANVMFDGQNGDLCPSKKCNIGKSACLISWKQLGVDGSIFYHIFLLQIC